ncbi:hypothetical protein ACFL6C_09145, partial [Myxococcota bacterium]
AIAFFNNKVTRLLKNVERGDHGGVQSSLLTGLVPKLGNQLVAAKALTQIGGYTADDVEKYVVSGLKGANLVELANTQNLFNRLIHRAKDGQESAIRTKLLGLAEHLPDPVSRANAFSQLGGFSAADIKKIFSDATQADALNLLTNHQHTLEDLIDKAKPGEEYLVRDHILGLAVDSKNAGEVANSLYELGYLTREPRKDVLADTLKKIGGEDKSQNKALTTEVFQIWHNKGIVQDILPFVYNDYRNNLEKLGEAAYSAIPWNDDVENLDVFLEGVPKQLHQSLNSAFDVGHPSKEVARQKFESMLRDDIGPTLLGEIRKQIEPSEVYNINLDQPTQWARARSEEMWKKIQDASISGKGIDTGEIRGIINQFSGIGGRNDEMGLWRPKERVALLSALYSSDIKWDSYEAISLARQAGGKDTDEINQEMQKDFHEAKHYGQINHDRFGNVIRENIAREDKAYTQPLSKDKRNTVLGTVEEGLVAGDQKAHDAAIDLGKYGKSPVAVGILPTDTRSARETRRALLDAMTPLQGERRRGRVTWAELKNIVRQHTNNEGKLALGARGALEQVLKADRGERRIHFERGIVDKVRSLVGGTPPKDLGIEQVDAAMLTAFNAKITADGKISWADFKAVVLGALGSGDVSQKKLTKDQIQTIKEVLQQARTQPHLFDARAKGVASELIQTGATPWSLAVRPVDQGMLNQLNSKAGDGNVTWAELKDVLLNALGTKPRDKLSEEQVNALYDLHKRDLFKNEVNRPYPNPADVVKRLVEANPRERPSPWDLGVCKVDDGTSGRLYDDQPVNTMVKLTEIIKTRVQSDGTLTLKNRGAIQMALACGWIPSTGDVANTARALVKGTLPSSLGIPPADPRLQGALRQAGGNGRKISFDGLTKIFHEVFRGDYARPLNAKQRAAIQDAVWSGYFGDRRAELAALGMAQDGNTPIEVGIQPPAVEPPAPIE